MVQKIRELARVFRSGRWDELTLAQMRVLVPVFVVFYALREFFRDRGQNLSSSLAFTTVLSLVPLLTVVTSALAVSGAFDSPDASLLQYLEPVFPSAAAKAAHYLQEFAQSSAAGVGGVSALAFVVVSIFLFVDIERAFNAIWHAQDRRPVFAKLLTYYFVVTFGPILMVTSVGLTARAQLMLSRFGLEMGFLGTFAPVLMALVLFVGVHWSLPGTRVRWWAAVIGGVFTAVAFEVAKFGFNLYVEHVVLESYTTIYGALGLFPIFLIWVYVSWIVVLFGAELAYISQNLRMVVEVDAAAVRQPERHKTNIYNPLVGLEVLAPVARQFKAGRGSLAESELVRSLGYPESFLRDVIGDLEQMGALQMVEDAGTEVRGVIPARPLEDIRLLEVVQKFTDFGEPNSRALIELQGEIQRVAEEVLGEKTAQSLVADVPEDVASEAGKGDVAIGEV